MRGKGRREVALSSQYSRAFFEFRRRSSNERRKRERKPREERESATRNASACPVGYFFFSSVTPLATNFASLDHRFRSTSDARDGVVRTYNAADTRDRVRSAFELRLKRAVTFERRLFYFHIGIY